MKPKIFIAIHYMEIGGAESSLIGLLEALDPARIDVDLFVYAHHGLFMKAIPDYVNLLPENKIWALYEEPLSKVIKKGCFKMAFARLMAKYKAYKFYRKNKSDLECLAAFSYVGKEVAKIVPKLNLPKYDLAISYLNPHDFVLKHVDAKKKICWIHTDYSRISIDVEAELPVWGAFDRIVSISPLVTKSFISLFPSLEDKILECENMLPKRYILKRADERCELVDKAIRGDVVNLCSIGRISYAKNYDNIPYIAKKLKDDGLKFRWFIIGPGNHEEIDILSKQLGVAEEVVFMGETSNPYAWLKACDIYVHPSRYEGKSIVVREAQVLCKPVIITNYPTAKSQINDGVDGIICDMSNDKIAEAIIDLSGNEEKKLWLTEYLKRMDYTGRDEVGKIYNLIIG